MAEDHKWAERAFDRQDELQSEMMRASIADAKEATRAAFFLNGAACIAILGFLSSLMSGDTQDSAEPILSAARFGLLWFAGGALFAAITSGLAYLCNSLYARAAGAMERSFEHPFIRETPEATRDQNWARRLNVLAVVTFALSHMAFGAGLFIVARAI